MQTITYELPRLLRLIKNNLFLIPQFQRPFRWKTFQVKLLVDSLVRSFPIGSLLVMGKNIEPALHSRTIEATIVADDSSPEGQMTEVLLFPPDLNDPDSSNIASKDSSLVLDGQQRITSIARVFLNADPKSSYYFDLKEMLEIFSKQENFGDSDTSWIKTYTKQGKEPERKKSNRWLRADIVLNASKTSIFITEYIEDSGDFDGLPQRVKRENVARLNELFESLRKYQIPIVSIDGDQGLDSVCRVFETINSTGTRLTTFDLAVARFFPNPDLRQLNDQSRQAHPILSETGFSVEGDRILQVIALVYNYKVTKRRTDPTRSALLQITPDYVKEHWPNAAESLATAYKWVRGQGARPDTLPNASIIVAIAGLLMLHKDILNDIKRNFSSTLRRWYFTRILTNGAYGGATYRIYLDFADLINHADHQKELTHHDVPLTVDAVLKLTSSQDNQYKALQCIICMNAQEDIITQQPINDASNIEWHHIFAKQLAKNGNGWKAKHSVDTIANMVPIIRENNRKLSSNPPAKYIKDIHRKAIEDGTVGHLKNRFRASLIPFTEDIELENFADQFDISRFDSFVRARASMLLQKVREVIGASLLERNEPEVDEDGQSELLGDD
jgi:hypothetical protein